MKKTILIFVVTVILRSSVSGQLALEMTPALQAELDSIPELFLSQASENTTLPESVDNSDQIWMRPILNQGADNSCAQSAGIGYTFTYEINKLRNIAPFCP